MTNPPIIEGFQILLEQTQRILAGDKTQLSSKKEGWEYLDLFFTEKTIEIIDAHEYEENPPDDSIERCILSLKTFEKLLIARIEHFKNPKDFVLNIKVLHGSTLIFPPEYYYSLVQYLDSDDPHPIVDKLTQDQFSVEHISPLPVRGIARNYFPVEWSNQKIIKAVTEAKENSIALSQEEAAGYPFLIELMQNAFLIPDGIWKGRGANMDIIGWHEARNPLIESAVPSEYHGEPCPPDSENFEDYHSQL